MSYCTQTDLEEQIEPDDLIALTDDDGTGAVDTTVIARAIADADAEIESYCGTRYSLPFSPVPAMIRKVSVDISIYNLHSRRNLKIPEERQKRYDNVIRFLRDLAKGLISLGSDAPAEPDNGLPQASTVKTDKIFTTGKSSDGSAGSLDNY